MAIDDLPEDVIKHGDIGNFLSARQRGSDKSLLYEVVVSAITEVLLQSGSKVIITDGTTDADVVDYESDQSLKVALGHKPIFGTHISIQNQASGTTGFMLIDLSDTANWPHTNTGHIVIEKVIVQTNQTSSPAFAGDIQFGFLENVDANNGDFYRIGTLHGDRATAVGNGEFDFSMFGMDLEVDEWFGPITLNDTTFQTDVNLEGPDGTVSFPSGDGDFVMKLVSTSGNIDISVTTLYTTEP